MKKILVTVSNLSGVTQTAELEVCDKVAYSCTQQHMSVPPTLSEVTFQYFKNNVVPFIFGKCVKLVSIEPLFLTDENKINKNS